MNWMERGKEYRFRKFVERINHLIAPQLNPNKRLALFDEVEVKSRWNFDFSALMMIATGIAGMGLP